jgi:hypothetical protein
MRYEAAREASVWTPLIGTFIGAALAFAANAFSQYLQRRRDHRAAGNVALMLLAEQLSDFANYRYGFLKELDGKVAAAPDYPFWAVASPMIFSFSDSLHQDVASLGFLIERKNPMLITKILLAERRYYDLASIAARYNEACVERQQRTAQAFAGRESMTGAEQRAAVGPELIARYESMAAGILHRLAHDQAGYEDASKSLYGEMTLAFASYVVRFHPLDKKWDGDGRAEKLLEMLLAQSSVLSAAMLD